MLHLLHHGLPSEVFISRIGHLAARDLAGHKRSIQLHAKPFAKLAVIRQGPPDARNGRLEFNTLLDSILITHITQPFGCILAELSKTRNRKGAQQNS
jgi:hypothetical protein